MVTVKESDRITNQVEINIPSTFEFERVVRQSTAVLAKQLNLSEERSADLMLAVSEAVTNAIEHGNQGQSSLKVGVKFIISDQHLTIKISDKGQWEAAPATLATIPDELDLETR